MTQTATKKHVDTIKPRNKFVIAVSTVCTACKERHIEKATLPHCSDCPITATSLHFAGKSPDKLRQVRFPPAIHALFHLPIKRVPDVAKPYYIGLVVVSDYLTKLLHIEHYEKRTLTMPERKELALEIRKDIEMRDEPHKLDELGQTKSKHMSLVETNMGTRSSNSPKIVNAGCKAVLEAIRVCGYTPVPLGHGRCATCGEVYPRAAFVSVVTTRNGFGTKCVHCRTRKEKDD